MRISKYIVGMALACCAIFTSCDKDNEGAIYTTSFQNVSFEQEAPNTVTTSEESVVVPVRLTRSIASGAYTASFEIESEDNGIFSVDGNSVTFNDGEGVAFINLKASNLVKGSDYACTITLSGDAAATADTITNTQITQTLIKVHSDYNWVAAGTCKFIDWNFCEDEENGDSAEGVLIENGEGSNVYRIVNPFPAVYGSSAGTGNITFTLADDGNIELTEGRHAAAFGYTVYYDTANYAGYCNTSHEGNHYEVNHLLLAGSSLYLGSFEFIWDR